MAAGHVWHPDWLKKGWDRGVIATTDCDEDTAAIATSRVAWPAAIRRALAAEAEVERLRRLIERDRTGLAAALARVRRTVAGWAWLAAPGEWGCYEYGQRTVATLRGEIGRCLAEIETEAIDALRSSGSLVSDAFHGPKPADPAAGDGVQVTDDDGEAD